MNKGRYFLVERGGLPLTDEEKKAGWHFCVEWDFMLIGPDWPEMEACACKLRRKESGSSDSSGVSG